MSGTQARRPGDIFALPNYSGQLPASSLNDDGHLRNSMTGECTMCAMGSCPVGNGMTGQATLAKQLAHGTRAPEVEPIAMEDPKSPSDAGNGSNQGSETMNV